MLLKPTLMVGLKATSNDGSPLPLNPREVLDPSAGIGLGDPHVPLFGCLIDIPPHDSVRGRFAFSLSAGDVIQRFDGNLAIHMNGNLRTVFADVFSEQERIGGFNPVLRRLG